MPFAWIARMTPSEQRLHPASIVFDIARYARIFAWPALLAWMSGNRGRQVPGVPDGIDVASFETWLWVLILPSVGLSVVRFLTFRIQYGADELVIRSGLLFRNVRHVPFARVQNLDAVQNPFHRALGVVDVRVETGSGGSEPEARLNVLPAAALDEMRARVFAGRIERHHAQHADAAGDDAAGPPAMAGVERVPVVHLSPKDLLLLGLLENKGMVLVGAA